MGGTALLLIAAGWTSSWDSIRAAAQDIRSVQAAFTQEKHLQILSQPLLSQGRLIFAAPDRLRWEYEAPLASVLLMDEGRVLRFVQTGGKWTEDASASLSAMSFVMQEISRWMNPDFEARLEPGGSIILSPRKEALSKVIRNISLQLADAPGVIESVTVFEDDHNFTRLQFRDVIVNQTIDPTLFTHHP